MLKHSWYWGVSIAILFQFCVAISIFNFISCRESCRVPWQLPRPHLYPCSKEKHPLNYSNAILEIVLLPYPCLCKQLKWLNPRIIWELLDHSLEISHFDNAMSTKRTIFKLLSHIDYAYLSQKNALILSKHGCKWIQKNLPFQSSHWLLAMLTTLLKRVYGT